MRLWAEVVVWLVVRLVTWLVVWLMVREGLPGTPVPVACSVASPWA